MYDALTTTYTFSCPERGEASVALSSFRTGRAAAGRRCTRRSSASRSTAAAASEHPGLVSHDELDWAPLGLGEGLFLNLMTSRLDPIEDELADLAARRIQAGEWPWSFFCYPEERPAADLPVVVLPDRARGGRRRGRRRRPLPGLRERLDQPRLRRSTSTCRSTTTARSGSSSTSSAPDAERALEEFAAELYSARFDSRRLDLH